MKESFFNNTACSGQEEMVHLYLDGELSRTERETFEVHLQACRACRSLLAEMQGLFTELALLEDVPAPVSITSGVMARLPARRSSRQYALIGYLVLAGQIAIGLLLILAARPMIAPVSGTEWIEPSQQILIDLITSLANWVTESGLYLSQQVQNLWPPAIGLSGMNISPGTTLALVAGLGLAWLIGNAMLLYRQPPLLKNGGTR